MACNHPREKWIGTAQGIVCGECGQLINGNAPKVAPEPKVEKDPEPEVKPVKKPVLKKGGKK